MIRRVLSLFLFSLLLLPAVSYPKNDEKIESIREIYNRTNNAISSKQLYFNEFTLNKENLPWAAVGNYKETIQFFYGVNAMLGRYDLKKIVIRSEHSITRAYAEFVYDENTDLIFYYYKFHNGQGDTTESRCYFDNDELLRFIDEDQIIDDINKKYDEYRDAIIKRSSKFIILFSEYNHFAPFDIEELR